MASLSSRINIEKLVGSNFNIWKIKMEYVLVERDLSTLLNTNKPNDVKPKEWK
jgi:hypothetical protein